MKPPGEEPIVKVRTVEDLMEMAHGYQRSMVLFAAMDLGVFSALAGGPSDAASLARRLCADPRRPAERPGGGGAAGEEGKGIPEGGVCHPFPRRRPRLEGVHPAPPSQ